MFADELDEARTVLDDRITDIEGMLGAASLRALKQDIHSLKGLAAVYGFSVVAGLADALETAIAADAKAAPIVAYLDRMREALESDAPSDPRLLGVLLGVIDARQSA